MFVCAFLFEKVASGQFVSDSFCNIPSEQESVFTFKESVLFTFKESVLFQCFRHHSADVNQLR